MLIKKVQKASQSRRNQLPMISSPRPHRLEHKSAHIPRSEGPYKQPFGPESFRQELSYHSQAMAYGDLTERPFLFKESGVVSHQKFNGVVQPFIACFGNEPRISKSAKEKSTRSPFTVVRAKPFPAVFPESANQMFVEFPKAESLGREPLVELCHDPNYALTRIECVRIVLEQTGKRIHVWAEWPTSASTQELRI